MITFKTVTTENLKSYDNVNDVSFPVRHTKGSAGYDFVAPYNIVLNPNETQIVWTDIKALMNVDEVLMMYIRSSVGIKKGIILKNITGVIDSDYYGNPSNDGNIGLPLFNSSKEVVIIKKGEGVAQGIFIKYLTASNCNADTERTGGIGSTD